jgi:hypothetical protein
MSKVQHLYALGYTLGAGGDGVEIKQVSIDWFTPLSTITQLNSSQLRTRYF